MLERVTLSRQSLLHCPVVYGTEITHIIRSGIRAYVVFFQIGLILDHPVGIHFFEQEVTLPVEAHETVQRGRVSLCRAYLADLFQFPDEFSRISDESSVFRR